MEAPMTAPCRSPRSWRLILISFVASGWLAGCTQNNDTKQTAKQTTTRYKNPSAEQVARMLDSNVVEVAAFYHPFDPWLWTENHEKPCGLVIRALYLMGPEYKGVFGDGTIR